MASVWWGYLTSEWDPRKYHDTFEENVKKLIRARLEGREVPPVEKPARLAKVVDLMAALKQSLAQMDKKKAPQRAVAGQGEGEVEA